MTAARIAALLSIAWVAAASAACSATQPSKFYQLDSTATPGSAPSAPDAVIVGPVSIPASVDQPQFVVQVAPNRVEVDEYNRWIAPLGDSIARVVAGDLATLLGTPDVATAPFAHFAPVYRVTIDVQRFDSIQGEAAVLDAVWVVHKASSGSTRQGRTVAREAVQGEGFEGLAAAHSRAVAQMSSDIATAIRASADTTR
jgi:uncharacterized lipoprotein YmbA